MAIGYKIVCKNIGNGIAMQDILQSTSFLTDGQGKFSSRVSVEFPVFSTPYTVLNST